MEFRISLNNLIFYGYHGVLEEERKLGNEFIVNLSVWVPIDSKAEMDSIDSTVSYAELYEIVKQEMDNPVNLLETICLKISRGIKSRFPQLIKGEIRIEKLRPPISGMIGSASVSLEF